jgi:hypothetical protein
MVKINIVSDELILFYRNNSNKTLNYDIQRAIDYFDHPRQYQGGFDRKVYAIIISASSNMTSSRQLIRKWEVSALQ